MNRIVLDGMLRLRSKRLLIAKLFEHRHKRKALKAIRKLEQERDEIEDSLPNSYTWIDNDWICVKNWYRSTKMALWK